MSIKVDLSGRRFGRLTVLHEAERNSSGKIRWLCRCDCGKHRVVIGTLLMTNHIDSCGCTKNTKSQLYNCWADMLSRCRNPNCKAFKFYGARGITVCSEWYTYEKFQSWAVQSGYSSGMTIDRIDSSLGYFPENCQWIPPQENRLRGFRNKHVKLSDAALKNILDNPDSPAKFFAEKYGVTVGRIYQVRHGLYHFSKERFRG